MAVAPERVGLGLELRRQPVRELALAARDHQPRELDRRRGQDAGGGREDERLIKWHSHLTISRYACETERVLLHHDISSRLAQMRVDDLIAQAERERLARLARPARRSLRIRALRLAARGLRVEREIDFGAARVEREVDFGAARVPTR